MRNKAHRSGIHQRQAAPGRCALGVVMSLIMLLASLAELIQPVGDGRLAAVGAEPPAVHEEIAVVCPETVERLYIVPCNFQAKLRKSPDNHKEETFMTQRKQWTAQEKLAIVLQA